MKKTMGCVLAGVALLLGSGCTAGDQAVSSMITLGEIENITVQGVDIIEGPLTLSSGRWEGEPYSEGGASRPSVVLVNDILLHGNVTPDGSDDAIAFVSGSAGGSGSVLYMILVERDGPRVRNTLTVQIGDRVQVRSADIEQGVISLELVQHGEGDPMCCPGDLVTRSWSWQNGTLMERDVMVSGRIGPEMLAGETWRLVAWNSQELVPDSIQITLTYDNGNFAGTAGCNRYFSAVTQSDIPGDITVGIGGSTRMMCPPEIMIHESRFLAILPKVNQIGFLNGRLYLGYLENESARILLFERSL